MRIWLGASWVVLSALLISTTTYSQDTKTPFGPVPAAQRNELANRLTDYTDAFRARNWDSLYDLAADVNEKRSDGRRMSRKTFGQLLKDGFDSYRLLKFTPIRTEMTSGGQFDVYGCGEFPSGEKKPERVAVAVRAVLPDQMGFTIAVKQGPLFIPFSRVGFWTCLWAAVTVTVLVVIRAMMGDITSGSAR